jgi:class 3 adenylate cyclase
MFRQDQQASIRRRFLRISIPLIFVSVAGVFSVIELMTHKNLVNQLNDNLNDVMETHSASLASPLWSFDDEQIDLALKAIIIQDEIVTARIFNEDGTIRSEAGKQELPEKSIVLIGDVTYDPGEGSKTIGKLEIIATEIAVWQHTKERIWVAAGIALIAVLMEVATALYALRKIVQVPLERLLESINLVRSGSGRKHVDWQINDELGQVIYAFNEMQNNQSESEQQLRDARDLLEQRVEERTRELAGKTSALEKLSKQLSKYLSPQVYNSIFTGEQEVKINSNRKKLTVFFSDIVGFTETTDRLESEELTNLLNDYLTEMSSIALEYGATIDKYVGDAILIFFGDPVTKGVKEDALSCVKMAVAMREKLTELQEKWRSAGIATPLRCRMGIHTDYCTVGNFGSEDRMDYTIIGHGVNVASRLESQAEPGDILISYETYSHVNDEIVCYQRDELIVKGIAYPIDTYKVADMKSESTQEIVGFEKALPSIELHIDQATMTPSDRQHAINLLHEGLEYLLESSRAENDSTLNKK